MRVWLNFINLKSDEPKKEVDSEAAAAVVDLVVDVATEVVVAVCLVEMIMIAVDEEEEDAVVEDVVVVVAEAVVVEWAGFIFKQTFLSSRYDQFKMKFSVTVSFISFFCLFLFLFFMYLNQPTGGPHAFRNTHALALIKNVENHEKYNTLN